VHLRAVPAVSKNSLSRDEWKLMQEIIRLGGSATRAQLIEYVTEQGWHIPVARALQAMERKGKVTKTWDLGPDQAVWSRVPRELRRPRQFGDINKP
jgi:hypothetical protein